jgi:hypothetical protein
MASETQTKTALIKAQLQILTLRRSPPNSDERARLVSRH